MNKKLVVTVSLLLIVTSNAFAMTCSLDGNNIPCSEMPIWFWIVMVLMLAIFLLVGILSLYRPFIEWSIRFHNKLSGTKTEITPAAIKYRKITGVIFIIIAIAFLLMLIFSSNH